MLFVHEIHRVMGLHEDEFEDEYRTVWMPRLAETGDARLLYFMRLAHGTGRAYNMITLTGITDGAAWERLLARMVASDLSGELALDYEPSGLRCSITAPL